MKEYIANLSKFEELTSKNQTNKQKDWIIRLALLDWTRTTNG